MTPPNAQTPRVEWTGGECPVHRRAVVWFETRDGTQDGPRPAGLYDWSHDEWSTDIVAFWVISSPNPDDIARYQSEQADGEWIPWEGGETAPAGQIDEIRLRDGTTADGFDLDLTSLRWTHFDADDDIIAFRRANHSDDRITFPPDVSGEPCDGVLLVLDDGSEVHSAAEGSVDEASAAMLEVLAKWGWVRVWETGRIVPARRIVDVFAVVDGKVVGR